MKHATFWIVRRKQGGKEVRFDPQSMGDVMGIGLYTPAFSMPFVATPMRVTAEVTPALMGQIEGCVNQDPPALLEVDQFLAPQDRLRQLIGMTLPWGGGMLRFSGRDMPTPLLPPPPGMSSEDAFSFMRPEEWNLELVFEAVEKGIFSAIVDLDPGRAAELLKDLVRDTAHPLCAFDEDASPHEEVLLFQALELLGRAAEKEAVGVLSDVLAHPSSTQPELLKAVVGLHYLRAVETVPAILDMLERQPVPRDGYRVNPVRIAVIHALGNMGNLGALPQLSTIVAGTVVSERGPAIEAGGKIVMRVLMVQGEERAAKDPEIGESAAVGHALISWFVSQMQIIAFDASELPDVRHMALVALGKVGDEQHFEPLMQLLERFIDDDDFAEIDARYGPQDLDSILKGVISGLGWLGDPRADASVVTIAKDLRQEDDVRLEALEALHRLASAHAHRALEDIAQDEQDPLRLEAESLLRDLAIDDEDDDFDLD
jgi:HEAT repeat protein